MLYLDGGHGEGGGQILRTALVLSLLTGQAFAMENVRRGRPNPGLKPQHLHILKALQYLTESRVDGVAPGAMRLRFYPGPIRGGRHHVEIGTAGAIPLVLQTLVPVSIFAQEAVYFTITGGTDVRGAMTMDFWEAILLPFLRPFTDKLEFEVLRRGYYPQGGGQVRFSCEPSRDQNRTAATTGAFPSLALTGRGEFRGLHVISRASATLGSRRVAERQAGAFFAAMEQQETDVQIHYDRSSSVGSSITAWAEFADTRLGADALGQRGMPAEEVGRAAAGKLQQEIASPATVDVHAADNLMPWIALFGGSLYFSHLTGHLETNAWVIDQFLPGLLRLDADRVCVTGSGLHASGAPNSTLCLVN